MIEFSKRDRRVHQTLLLDDAGKFYMSTRGIMVLERNEDARTMLDGGGWINGKRTHKGTETENIDRKKNGILWAGVKRKGSNT